MESAPVRQIQHNLSRYLKEIEKGAEIRITYRKKPIAKIVPLEKTDKASFKAKRLGALHLMVGLAYLQRRSSEIDSWLESERKSRNR